MEWLGDLFSAGAGVASTGFLGVIGSLVGQLSNYFQEKQRQSWEKQKWQHEKDLINLNMKADAHETELELKVADSQGSWSGLSASIASDAGGGATYQWVNAVKKLYRPFVTTLLWVIAYVVFQRTEGVEELTDTQEYMIDTIYFTAATATMWWFGDRAFTPKQFKNS